MISRWYKAFNKNLRSPRGCIMLQGPEISFFEIFPIFFLCTIIDLYLKNPPDLNFKVYSLSPFLFTIFQ